MASITFTFSGNWSAQDLGFTKYPGNDTMQALQNFTQGLQTGAFSSNIDMLYSATNAVKASGTLTISSGSGAVGGTIGGTLVTATWATSDTVAAALVAAAINANTTVNKLCYATSALGVVTVTSNLPGPLGNKITLVASGTGVTASGATLASGAGADGQPTSFVLG
jgi:phage tail sheath gpL-like